MSELDRPVFVDPSGRRRQLVSVLAVLGAVLVASYLVLVLVAAVGGPDSPAAKLPQHPPAANPQPGVQPLTVVPITATEPGTTITQPQHTTTSIPATAPPAPPPPPAVTTSRPSRGARPSEPPGNGGPPTSAPGNGG